MNGTFSVTMGDRGRLVVPSELRDRLDLRAGAPLMIVETAGGFVVTTRAHVKQLVRDQLRGSDLVSELIADRRAAADAER